MTKVLFVCLGNICRSPAAEGILRTKLIERGMAEGENFIVDSAGTNGIIGSQPDGRSQQVCREHGLDISGQVGRRLTPKDGQNFDLIYCMDEGNLARTKQIIPSEYHQKISLITDGGVGDPYQLGPDGFEQMYSQLDRVTDDMIHTIVG